MLLRFKSPFNLEDPDNNQSNKTCKRSSNKTSLAVGLRILTQISHGESNIVVKSSSLRLSQSQPHRLPQNKSLDEYSCFLKTCHLCDKNLSPDKDVYMYRGDQGFCSVECRSRQIVLDEMRELETSTKKMVASYRHFYNGSSQQSETRILLEDLRHRHNRRPIPCQRNWPTVS